MNRPRVVKHRVSNYAKKHPHHRPVPPLLEYFSRPLL